MQSARTLRTSPDGSRMVAICPSLASSCALLPAESVRQEHVALLAVGVVQQPDTRRAIRVVLDRRDARRHAEFVAPPVDHAVEPLVPASLVADGELALAVAPG